MMMPLLMYIMELPSVIWKKKKELLDNVYWGGRFAL